MVFIKLSLVALPASVPSGPAAAVSLLAASKIEVGGAGPETGYFLDYRIGFELIFFIIMGSLPGACT